ncbi:HI1506-related protein, partial [Ferrovibrio sp.]|uniref:HI1506-related protein n=1 Tax=Ferrovibrio sp. TaxID=1917215 RepID=UPI0035AF61B1
MAKEKKKVPGFQVTAKRDGFRRAGLTHTGTTFHPANTLTKQQIDALKNESMLVVVETEQ